MKPLGRPFAVGRTAEVYAWEKGKILKLYYDWCPSNWIEHEAKISQAVSQTGVPVPAVGEIVEVDGRRGIAYERVDGPSMLAVMSSHPLKLIAYAKMLAELHVEMHQRSVSGLPSQREGLVRSIRSAKSLPEDRRESFMSRLEQLPDGDRLCHGDFHPGNVILTNRGPVIIDWMTAVSGHPASDVARTRLLLSLGDPPNQGITRLIILVGRRVYLRNYLRRYEALVPGTMAQSDEFLHVQAAARLNEEIASERMKLLKLIGGG